MEHYFVPVNENRAAVGGLYSAQHIYERAFTRAVFPQKRKNFTFVYCKGYIAVSGDSSEGFADVFKFDIWMVRHTPNLSFIQFYKNQFITKNKMNICLVIN